MGGPGDVSFAPFYIMGAVGILIFFGIPILILLFSYSPKSKDKKSECDRDKK
jgi:hypothetical protein